MGVASSVTSRVTSGVASTVTGNILPLNELVAWGGDSRLDQGTFENTPSSIEFENNGMQHWALGLSGGRFRMRFADDYSVSGNSTQSVLESVPDLIATDCETVVVLTSINDRDAAVDADWTISRLIQIIQQITAAGKVLVLCNEMPVSYLDGTQTAYHIAVKNWINGQHKPADGVYVADTWGALESTPGSNTPASGVYRDTKHPSTLGAYLAGQALANVLETLRPYDPNVLPADASDSRLLSTNPFMTGTGGTIVPSKGGSGSIATGFTYTTSSSADGILCTMSKETLSDGNEWQKYVFSGTPADTGAVDLARQQSLQSGWTASSYCEAVLKVRMSTDFTSIRSVKSGVRIVGSEDNWHTSGDETVHSEDFMPTFASEIEMIIRTPRIQNPGSLTNLVLRPGLYPIGAEACAGTIWIGVCALMEYAGA